MLKTPKGSPCGYLCMVVWETGEVHSRERIGELVALTWLGPLPPGAALVYLNGDPLDNRVSNLAYGTREELLAAFAARARREEAAGSPKHCGECGDRLADSWEGNYGERYCPGCGRSRVARAQRDRVYRRRVNRIPHVRGGGPCLDCGVELPARVGPGGVAKRCPECAEQAQRRSTARHGAKRLERARVARQAAEAAARCVDCGGPVPSRRSGPIAERCTDCAASRARQMQQQSSARHRAKRRQSAEQRRNP